MSNRLAIEQEMGGESENIDLGCRQKSQIAFLSKKFVYFDNFFILSSLSSFFLGVGCQ